MAKRILIIDDSEFDRRMVTLAMESTGSPLHYYEFSDGKDALTTIREFQPDLTLLDIRLPGKSGFDVLSDIRGDNGLKTLRVVLVSGSKADCDRDRAMEMGACAYYQKPHRREYYASMADEINREFL